MLLVERHWLMGRWVDDPESRSRNVKNLPTWTERAGTCTATKAVREIHKANEEQVQ